MMKGLEYLLGAYFHEDWDHAHTTWQEVVDSFLDDNPARIRQVPKDIDLLLSSVTDDDELERVLMDMGMAYDPDEGDALWLQAVRDRIVASLRASTRPSDTD